MELAKEFILILLAFLKSISFMLSVCSKYFHCIGFAFNQDTAYYEHYLENAEELVTSTSSLVGSERRVQTIE